jgi:hypothetical protein
VLGVAASRGLFVVLALVAASGLVAVRYWYPEAPTVTLARFERTYRRLKRDGWGAGRYLQTTLYGPGRVYWSLATLRPEHARRLAASSLGRYFAAATLFSVGFAVFWVPMPAFLVGVATAPVPSSRCSSRRTSGRQPPTAARGRCRPPATRPLSRPPRCSREWCCSRQSPRSGRPRSPGRCSASVSCSSA